MTHKRNTNIMQINKISVGNCQSFDDIFIKKLKSSRLKISKVHNDSPNRPATVIKNVTIREI